MPQTQSDPLPQSDVSPQRDAGTWVHRLRRFQRRGLLLPLLSLAVNVLLIGACSYLLSTQPELVVLLFALQFVLTITALLLMGLLIARIHQQLLSPLSHLRDWATRIRGGDLSARLPASDGQNLGELAQDINHLGDVFQALSQNMDEEVRRQTERLAQKTNSLQVLYDVAASLNASRDLNDLLTRFLHTMRDIVDARAGTVRLLTDKGQMELVASIGLDESVIEKERMVPVQRCLCGNALTGGEVLFQKDLLPCQQLVGQPLLPTDSQSTRLEMIAVPLEYQGKNLGVYNLFVERTAYQSKEEVKALFTSIGRHLGMAIDKARLDDEAKRLYIMQERNAIAHELHDSLAQTLASLRFQVSRWKEGFENLDEEATRVELQQLKGGLDDAYTELRELLAHFRAPMNSRGLMPALEDLVSGFRKQTGVHILLQKEWESTQLPANMEMQVLRIAQEALANVRKHSQAHTVRVLLRSDKKKNEYTLLIEDDGAGMSKPAFSGHPGEHIGLSIMQERARFLGGELRVESEEGEGTRVQLRFRYPNPDPQRQNQRYELI